MLDNCRLSRVIAFTVPVLMPLLVIGCSPDERRTSESAQRAKNVVLITIDTLRADHLGSYGYSRHTSPRIDALARDGVRFADALAQWPKTTPSVASMLTGLYPHSTGIVRTCTLILAERFTSLAERLEESGYSTVAVVTNPVLGREYGFDQGFEYFSEAWKTYRATANDDIPGPDCQSRNATIRALDGVDHAPPDRPLFLWVHYNGPHSPYDPPAEYRDRFVNDAHYDASRIAPFHAADDAPTPMDEGFGGIPRHVRIGDEQRVAQYVALYDAEIYANDEQVGALLDGLRRRGILDDALVILTADHGEDLGEHGTYFVHGSLAYDACAHVPLIVQGAGLPAGTVIEDPVALLGLHSTVLEWAGIAAESDVEGESLMPVIRGEQAARNCVFSAAGYRRDYQCSLRWNQWKLIHVRDELDRERMTGAEYELYDIASDPGESRNVIEENRRVAELLQRRLSEWVAEGAAKNVPPASQRASSSVEDQEAIKALGYAR